MVIPENMRVNGYKVLAWVQTEVQSTGPCGYILAKSDVGGQHGTGQYVTAWYRLGCSEWCHGNYFQDEALAREDFKERYTRALSSRFAMIP